MKYTVEEIERMLEGITAEPWFVMGNGFSRKGLWSAPTVYSTDDELRYIAVCACADFANGLNATDNVANAQFIAAAPSIIRSLLAQLREKDRETAQECIKIIEGYTTFCPGGVNLIRQKYGVDNANS